ncbi:hypothetical protein KFL_005730100 [Klebsormidium nitens]|uniref:Uncharacterized protein n=1 Tax=Klebsormidium nitens TaxID=105231 RepID=A0A0U9HKX8_KLENI|nr:hypothetical protein KFL_005730100 [Klebsormidium nitens]|eukprot:GAQ89889.1 hypothetical protein KFL_005730100 [Klebsormidium nitens]
MDGCTIQLLLPENVSGDDNVALGGYSPLSVFRGKPCLGREDITFAVLGVKYRFQAKRELEEFAQDTGRYIPAFGGWCAWHMYQNVKMVPEYAHSTKGEGGVLLLFHADADVNCLLLWDEMAAKIGEGKMMEQAERNWQGFRKLAGSVPREDVTDENGDGKAGG